MINKTDEKIIKDAQYRKGISIAFFNATNSAISIVAPVAKDLKVEEIKKAVVMYRDFFLEEYKNYYATTISNIGGNYNIDESIKKLKNTTGIDELRDAWRLLSEDERHDPIIMKLKKELKSKYEKN
jgi:hypothetical protein